VILAALQQYGMIMADNGSSMFITGDPDSAWDNNDLDELKTVPASAFEVVLMNPIYTSPTSRKARAPPSPASPPIPKPFPRDQPSP